MSEQAGGTSQQPGGTGQGSGNGSAAAAQSTGGLSDRQQQHQNEPALSGQQRSNGVAQDQQPQGGQQDAPRYKIGDNFEISEAEARGLMERHALEQSRKATMPANANGYKLSLPEGFVTPQGVEFVLNENDPVVPLAKEFAHQAGLSQEQFSKLAGIYASARINETAEFNRAADAERTKLGATGAQRVTAIEQFLRAHMGDEDARPFMLTLVTAAQVRGWEKIMMKLMNQGATGPSSAHREPPEPQGTLPAEHVDRMTSGQRLDYARGFDQSQMPAWRDPR